MNTPPEVYFLHESLAHARDLPVKDSVHYLKGLCLSVKDDAFADRVRLIMTTVSSVDSQLELIQSGQLKLPLAN
ncbi:MAG: hypothetical protein JWM16_568 [Verrucomicrobiales bacterium]|nr:hypothetical protein [Verrucomicrobiales bacterium]